MSFVYAEKNTLIGQEIITIHSDTKLGLPDDASTIGMVLLRCRYYEV